VVRGPIKGRHRRDFAQVDADAELDAIIRRHVRVAILHRALDLDCALNGFDHARGFDEEVIAAAVCLENPLRFYRLIESAKLAR
jgi:hypothetical protein